MNKLKNLEITEGSLVDKGANQESKVMLFKNSAPEGGETVEELEKKGATFNAQNLGILRQFLNSLRGMPGIDIETKKGESMSDENGTEEIPEDVQKRIDDLQTEADKVNGLESQIEDLTKRVEELNKDEDEDILKDASEDVKKAMVDMQKQIDEARKEAKEAKDSQHNQEIVAKAGELTAIGSVETVTEMLNKADEAGLLEDVEGILETLKGQIEANDAITKEFGVDTDSETSPEAKLSQLVKAYAEEHDVSEAKAMKPVLATEEGQRLYNERGEN